MRRGIFSLSAAIFLVLAVTTPASATMSGHEASVVDPYANCTIGQTPTGVNYPNTEPEAWLAHNRANPDNFVGTFQQDRWSDGGARGLTAAYSFNDAHKWSNVALPFSKCAIPYYGATPCPLGGVGSPASCTLPYDRASDPWNDFGGDGIGYTVSISFNANDNNNAVGGAVTLDGGRTWVRGTEIQHDLDADPTAPFNDKESVTADPKRSQTAYAVWDRLVLVDCGPAGRSTAEPKTEDRKWKGAAKLAAPGTVAAPSSAALTQPCFEGPTYFSKTTNGGLSWSTPRPIVTNSPDEQTIANQVVVTPSGRLYDFYTYFAASGSATVEDIFSDDAGLTWSPRHTVNDLLSVGITDPQTGAKARTGDIIPEPAVDPTTGQLYIVWQDGRFSSNKEDDVVISTSMTGITGTWSAPVRVNLPEDRAGFTPAIKVDDLGLVAVDYYSLRHPDLGPDVWPTNRYIRFAEANLEFGQPTHVAGPFNMLMAPDAGGFFVGDYEGMAVDRNGRSVHTFFAQTNCDTTKCPAVPTTFTGLGTPGAANTEPGAHDPFDVYSNQYFKNH